MRKTKIVCTIGPACDNEETLERMCLAGMNVARLNFSHGTHPEQQQKMDLVKMVREKLNLPIAIMLDTKGPEYRIRTFENGSITLREGDTFTFTTEQIVGNQERVSVSYPGLIHDLEVGDKILLNNGLLVFEVGALEGTEARCRVLVGGETSNNKSMSFPNKVMSQVYLSEQDKADLLLGLENEVDYIACSFVSRKQDILDVKDFIAQHTDRYIGIIAKIENQAGIDNIEEICQVCDGVMVARGDLGVEVPFEKLPAIQKKLINTCRRLGKRSITATEMLESMIHNPRPTRAEATDIANAIYDGTTAIMLSGESANGDYPVEAVKTMARIAERTEQDIDFEGRLKKRAVPDDGDTTTAISHATCTLAADLKVKAIITVTMSGFTAAMISRFKPSCPVIGCAVKRLVWRQLNLQWGVQPLLIQEENTTEDLFNEAVTAALNAGYIQHGDKVIITAGVPLGISGMTNQLRVVEV